MDKLLRPKDLEVDANATNAEKVFKFWLRTVEEAETYERVIEILKQTFIKRKNNVYARHLLVSRRQSSTESTV